MSFALLMAPLAWRVPFWIHGQGTASTLIFIVEDLTSPALPGCRIFLTFGDYLSDPTKREAQTCGQLSVNSPQTSSDIYHLMPENAARVLPASSAPTAPRSLRPSPLSAFGFCWAPGFVSPPFAFRGHVHAVPGALTCPRSLQAWGYSFALPPTHIHRPLPRASNVLRARTQQGPAFSLRSSKGKRSVFCMEQW